MPDYKEYSDHWVDKDGIKEAKERAAEVHHEWAIRERYVDVGRPGYLCEVRRGADPDAINYIFCTNSVYREVYKERFLSKMAAGKLRSPLTESAHHQCPLCVNQT